MGKINLSWLLASRIPHSFQVVLRIWHRSSFTWQVPAESPKIPRKTTTGRPLLQAEEIAHAGCDQQPRWGSSLQIPYPFPLFSHHNLHQSLVIVVRSKRASTNLSSMILTGKQQTRHTQRPQILTTLLTEAPQIQIISSCNINYSIREERLKPWKELMGWLWTSIIKELKNETFHGTCRFPSRCAEPKAHP